MSTSRVVELVVGALLLAGLGYLAHREYPLFQAHDEPKWLLWVFVGCAVYAAVCTAALARRIADPTLKTPVVAWVVIILFWIGGIISLFTSSNKETYGTYSYELERDRRRDIIDGPKADDPKGIGLWTAIASTLVSAGCYGGLVYLIYYIGLKGG